MKNLIPVLLIFLLTSCSNNKDMEGYWFGEFKIDKGRNPALLKFENNTYIDFFGPSNDTITFQRSGNRISFKNGFSENHVFKIKLNNDELSTCEPKSDSIIITLKKSRSNNFVFDFLNDKDLKLDLPSGNGLKNKFGGLIQLRWPLYLTYKNNRLIANFLDTTVILDSNYHKFLFTKKTSLDDFESYSNSNRISLIADKNLKISDIDNLRKQLKIVGFSRIDYYLKSESYDKVNILTSKLKPLTAKDYIEFNTEENPLPPLPPPFIDYIPSFKGELMIVKIEGNILTANDSIIAIEKFNEFIKPKILSDKELAILYYITPSSTYDNFIQFNEIVYNTYYDLRDEYLMNKYGFKFRENYNSRSEEITDAKKKYPLIFWQMDSLEYKKIKYNL